MSAPGKPIDNVVVEAFFKTFKKEVIKLNRHLTKAQMKVVLRNYLKDYYPNQRIHRNINGVIQVGQDAEERLVQALNEYVKTKDLRPHFTAFFDNYSKAIHNPMDKIGGWICGFFGSGKYP